jgi:hypothetical protein
MDTDTSELLKAVSKASEADKEFIVFGLQHLVPTSSYKTEILGYSLMGALGITGEELENKGQQKAEGEETH